MFQDTVTQMVELVLPSLFQQLAQILSKSASAPLFSPHK
jgi:hypothetical protein